MLTAAGLAVALAARVMYGEKRCLSAVAFAIRLLLLAADAVLGALSVSASNYEQALKWYRWRFVPLSFTPATWLVFAVTYARGNYQQFWKRWLPVIALLLLIAPATLAIYWEELFNETLGQWRLGNAGRIIHLCLVLGATAVLMNIERTFRASVGLMRWRLKFMVIGLAALFLTRIYTSTQFLIFSAVNESFETFNAVALAICAMLGFGSLRRTQGFALDLYPSPALVYRSFAVLLIGGYLLAVGFLANAIRFLGGSNSFPFQAFLLLVALVVLSLLLVSDRVRMHLKRFVSTHLRRPVHDVRKVWRTFSETTAGQVEEAQLCRVTVKWIAETFDALSVTIWLVPQHGSALSFGASTSLTDEKAAELVHSNECATLALEKLQKHANPLDVDASREKWTEAVRSWHPAKFSHGGNRVCVPVASGGELIGLMMLGDRVAGIPFSAEELDLLKCIADQIAGDLVRIRLSRRLVEAKEMQAFQTMATFFIHDLKNTAWTLSLLLENLRTHFDDPQFRDEAVRSVSKSVGRINDLIGRIGSLRSELQLHRAPADLNEVVESALKELGNPTDVSLVKKMTPLPQLELDREQMQKVFVNLLVNASEASETGGQIRVGSEQRNGDVIVSVQDDGCGMAPEFLKDRLFKPFQTTKKKGIGIGMFQSKMIVEAHGGRIEVDSKKGEGTTFRIVLPLKEGTH